MPSPAADKYRRDVLCAGKCGAVQTIAEPPLSRPLLRAAAALYYSMELVAKGWEWDGPTKSWYCRPCRVRRRMVKLLP